MPFKWVSKDHLGGAICVLLGGGAMALGLTYGIGTLNDMGPGFVPVAVGVLLVVVGIVTALTGVRAPEARFVDGQRGKTDSGPQWRGWICILGGMAAFIVVGTWGGLLPASFLSVFISALGDRNNTLKSAAVLAAVLTVFAVGVFHFLLSLQLPLFRWG